MIKFEVIDRQIGKKVGGLLKSRKAARTKADRLDNNYGAYRYYSKEIETDK